MGAGQNRAPTDNHGHTYVAITGRDRRNAGAPSVSSPPLRGRTHAGIDLARGLNQASTDVVGISSFDSLQVVFDVTKNPVGLEGPRSGGRNPGLRPQCRDTGDMRNGHACPVSGLEPAILGC